jgi:hypothetical protein
MRSRKPAGGPTRLLFEYAGDYEHPGYGRISIDLEGGALHWRFRGLSGTLNHCHYDVFEVPEDPTAIAPDMLAITFLYDREGNINRLSALFEPQGPDIFFTRVAGGAGFDPQFLAGCAGTYQGGATRHVVKLEEGGTLTLSPTDQPTYHLVPYADRVFLIKELEGYRVEFWIGEEDKVEKILFHQPNGTFVAERSSE